MVASIYVKATLVRGASVFAHRRVPFLGRMSSFSRFGFAVNITNGRRDLGA